MTPHRLGGPLVIAALAAGTACAPVAAPHSPPANAIQESVTRITLDEERFDVHLAVPARLVQQDLLVVYASGDGGWFGAAIDQWRQVARAGYAVAGISSRALLRVPRPSGALTPERLATDYQQIIGAAQHSLRWTAAPRIVLAGWSRGAAFAVLAAAESPLRERTEGVVAIGLAEGEDMTIDGDGDDTDDGGQTMAGQQWPFDTYQRTQLLSMPCAVIQATHDNYFPAADAQRRFGPNTGARRFYAVDARNHRFSGGGAAFHAALLDALHWMTGARLVPPPSNGL